MSTYDKTEMNRVAQSLYDQKMQEGKHGHYESMFHVVHKCIQRYKDSQPSAAFTYDGELLEIVRRVAAIGFHLLPKNKVCTCSKCELVRDAIATSNKVKHKDKVYTADALRDVLEQAAQEVLKYEGDASANIEYAANAIRALKEQVK